jgi:hypothetical protein
VGLADQHYAPRVPADWLESVWPAFQADVLAYLRRGCELLRADRNRSPSWKERNYTWALVRHLEKIREDRWEHLSPRYDQRPLSDEDFAAGESPHGANLIDIAIRYNHKEPDPHLPVEAKVVCTTTVGNYKPGACATKYIKEGMQRFTSDHYGPGIPLAVMIGYIISGTAPEIVAMIECKVDEMQFPCNQRLAKEPESTDDLPVYISDHPRSGTHIVIHHIFLLFP